MISNKEHVLGCLRAEGPCTMGRLVYELLVQAVGVWDDLHMHWQAKEYHARLAVVEALNELFREGKAILDDTGDAFDYNYEEDV